jgi:hypothetical protein
MRYTTLAALLVFTACATTEKKPVAEATPAAESKPEATPAAAAGAVTVEFASAAQTKTGGAVVDTNYSEKPGDTIISGQSFKDGVITYAGQVGTGKGSAWAGIGLNWQINAEGKPIDATKFKSITFRLAATTRLLRLRVSGNDAATQKNGCYPVYTQEVTETMTEYTIPLDKFQPEGWCAKLAVDIKQTLPAVTGNEVASINVSKKPITISVGPTTYNP